MAASDSFNTPTKNCENLQASFAALQQQAFCTSLLQIMFFVSIHSRGAFGNASALPRWWRARRRISTGSKTQDWTSYPGAAMGVATPQQISHSAFNDEIIYLAVHSLQLIPSGKEGMFLHSKVWFSLCTPVCTYSRRSIVRTHTASHYCGFRIVMITWHDKIMLFFFHETDDLILAKTLRNDVCLGKFFGRSSRWGWGRWDLVVVGDKQASLLTYSYLRVC